MRHQSDGNHWGGYTLINLNAAGHVGKRLTLFGVINTNALDKRYYNLCRFRTGGANVPWPERSGEEVSDREPTAPVSPITVYGRTCG